MLVLICKSLKLEKYINLEKNSICRGYLTDRQYLEHMIPHHQVAIDVSNMLIKITKSPEMHEIIRKLIWTQKYEIELMDELLKTGIFNVTSGKQFRKYQTTISDFMAPNVLQNQRMFCDTKNLKLSDTFCDPHFFNPKSHMDHMKHMKLDDAMYIHHMIPHHQVAIDMSKVLLMNTKSDMMIYIAYRIIRSQNAEIIILNDFLKKSTYRHKSNLLN
tara:strand:+ start:1857 stop:2504 length:648 start_codon:yes stop_codon:yes gene_type:complete